MAITDTIKRPLGAGSQGADVAAWQQQMAVTYRFGKPLYTGPIDGVWNDACTQGTIQFNDIYLKPSGALAWNARSDTLSPPALRAAPGWILDMPAPVVNGFPPEVAASVTNPVAKAAQPAPKSLPEAAPSALPVAAAKPEIELDAAEAAPEAATAKPVTTIAVAPLAPLKPREIAAPAANKAIALATEMPAPAVVAPAAPQPPANSDMALSATIDTSQFNRPGYGTMAPIPNPGSRAERRDTNAPSRAGVSSIPLSPIPAPAGSGRVWMPSDIKPTEYDPSKPTAQPAAEVPQVVAPVRPAPATLNPAPAIAAEAPAPATTSTPPKGFGQTVKNIVNSVFPPQEKAPVAPSLGVDTSEKPAASAIATDVAAAPVPILSGGPKAPAREEKPAAQNAPLAAAPQPVPARQPVVETPAPVAMIPPAPVVVATQPAEAKIAPLPPISPRVEQLLADLKRAGVTLIDPKAAPAKPTVNVVIEPPQPAAATPVTAPLAAAAPAAAPAPVVTASAAPKPPAAPNLLGQTLTSTQQFLAGFTAAKPEALKIEVTDLTSDAAAAAPAQAAPMEPVPAAGAPAGFMTASVVAAPPASAVVPPTSKDEIFDLEDGEITGPEPYRTPSIRYGDKEIIPSIPLELPFGRPEDKQRAWIRENGISTKRISPFLVNVDVGSDYGMRRHPIQGVNKMHRGIDVPVAGLRDRRLVAPIGGFIDVDRDARGKEGSMIIIHGDDDKDYMLMHLSKGSIPKHWRDGDRVEMGELIAIAGGTGRVTGPHLHFEIRENVLHRDTAIDPDKLYHERLERHGTWKRDVTEPLTAAEGAALRQGRAVRSGKAPGRPADDVTSAQPTDGPQPYTKLYPDDAERLARAAEIKEQETKATTQVAFSPDGAQAGGADLASPSTPPDIKPGEPTLRPAR